MSSSPTFEKKSSNEIYFDIIDCLCNRFMGLTPFEVMNAPLDEVMDLYVDCILHDRKDKTKGKSSGDEWVTSKTASWH